TSATFPSLSLCTIRSNLTQLCLKPLLRLHGTTSLVSTSTSSTTWRRSAPDRLHGCARSRRRDGARRGLRRRHRRLRIPIDHHVVTLPPLPRTSPPPFVRRGGRSRSRRRSIPPNPKRDRSLRTRAFPRASGSLMHSASPGPDGTPSMFLGRTH